MLIALLVAAGSKVVLLQSAAALAARRTPLRDRLSPFRLLLGGALCATLDPVREPVDGRAIMVVVRE